MFCDDFGEIAPGEGEIPYPEDQIAGTDIGCRRRSTFDDAQNDEFSRSDGDDLKTDTGEIPGMGQSNPDAQCKDDADRPGTSF